ncbi:MAG: ribonuclease R [Thermodesulfovibrionia bacterium]
MATRPDIEREAILNFLRDETTHPVSLGEIARTMGFKKADRRHLKRVLNSLIASGIVCKTRYGLYGLSERMNLVTGFFEAHRDGYGFVVPDRSGGFDIFIPPRRTLGAMSGDHVVARIESERRREGSIIRILKRGQKKVVGRLFQDRNLFYVRPKNKKIPSDIYISPKNRAGARTGDNVVVELISYPTPGRPPEGRVIRIIPEIDEPSLEIEAIIDEYSLSTKFPAAVSEEIDNISDKVTARNRIDLRKKLTVTIDGENAKDFDDAISIERTHNGYKLFVHIADVSHYVSWDSAIDIEARRRGTSVYFPGMVIPMLPKRLSNDLCSLLPRVDRYTFTVELNFDKEGELISKDFYPSVINSDERMTYASVKKVLLDRDPHERKRYEYLLESLDIMQELCEILRERRMKRGSLDFDLPEPEVLLDIQGRPEGIIKAERDISHMIIEEFMISANEAVASFLQDKGVTSIYRVHERPDPSKIEELKPIFNAFGLRINKIGHHLFHSILRQVKGMPAETLLNIILLRSLKQARYSTENIGHFGLASDCYTHFTSPIRRYPDLVVHRILKDVLNKKGMSNKRRIELEGILPEIAINSSRTERLADEAERDVINAMRVWFMKDKVGGEYEGIVSSVGPYGLKVQFKDFFVEGSLHVSSMMDDYYKFDEKGYRLIGRRTKRVFTLGTEVNVRVDRVDTEEKEIILSLV